MSLIVLYFLHSTSVLSFYIDVVLAISILSDSVSIFCTGDRWIPTQVAGNAENVPFDDVIMNTVHPTKYEHSFLCFDLWDLYYQCLETHLIDLTIYFIVASLTRVG